MGDDEPIGPDDSFRFLDGGVVESAWVAVGGLSPQAWMVRREETAGVRSRDRPCAQYHDLGLEPWGATEETSTACNARARRWVRHGEPDATSEKVTVTVTGGASEPTTKPTPTEPAEWPSSSEPPASDRVLAVGETFTSPRGGKVTLESVERRTAGLGHLEVLIAGLAGPEGGDLNQFGFTIVGPAGFRYDPAFGETSVPPLSSDQIPPGGTFRGAILFDVPEGVWNPTLSEIAAT